MKKAAAFNNTLGTVLLAGLISGSALARETATIDQVGTTHVEDLSLPLSDMLSPEARRQIAARMNQAPPKTGEDFVTAVRASSRTFLAPIIARWQTIYPATVESVTMAGVRTDVVTPAGGIAPGNRDRVLINLHGGGFFTGGGGPGGQVESIPLAGTGRIKVVSVDYRLGPEARYPAATQDVEAVYRALLKQYKPGNIGIYGCSAGGTLTAQSVVAFSKHGLPRPGAVGIFCSGVMPNFWYGGDATAAFPLLNGRPAPGSGDLKFNPYLEGADLDDPLITPGVSSAVIAQFPPTLFVTSTRDIAMGNVLMSNMAFLRAGVDTQLLVQEGLGHGDFSLIPGAPEAIDAHDVIWHFFDRHLGR